MHCIHFHDKKRWKNYLILRSGTTIPSMIKKYFHQPPPDALVKIKIRLASTDSVPRPLDSTGLGNCHGAAKSYKRWKYQSKLHTNPISFKQFGDGVNSVSHFFRVSELFIGSNFINTSKMQLKFLQPVSIFEPMTGMLLSRTNWQLYHHGDI